MPNIDKEMALKIAKKLEADVIEGSKHDVARVFHEGRMIAHFGIRRGSKKNLGHDHVPGQIFVQSKQAKLLGQCPLSREEWLRILSEKSKI